MQAKIKNQCPKLSKSQRCEAWLRVELGYQQNRERSCTVTTFWAALFRPTSDVGARITKSMDYGCDWDGCEKRKEIIGTQEYGTAFVCDISEVDVSSQYHGSEGTSLLQNGLWSYSLAHSFTLPPQFSLVNVFPFDFDVSHQVAYPALP